MMKSNSLVTTAAKVLDAKLSIGCDHHACDGLCDSAGCVDIRGAAEVVVGAVLAAQREQVEAIPRPDTHFESELFDMVFDSGWAMMREAVLALLAVVENDQ